MVVEMDERINKFPLPGNLLHGYGVCVFLSYYQEENDFFCCFLTKYCMFEIIKALLTGKPKIKT